MADNTENAPTPEKQDPPLPMSEPAMATPAEPVRIDLATFESRIEGGAASGPTAEQVGRFAKQHAPLAASLALAAVLGAAASHGLSGASASGDDAQALQQQVARLAGELAALKSDIEAANRTAAVELGKVSEKLGERLARAEKAQGEPAAKLAKITERLDKLERRPAAPAAAAAADVTGSVPAAEKPSWKPPTVEGWRLLDHRAGRALLESRDGTLFDVVPGSNLPGLGRIETIKRVDGKVVVTTRKGVITSSVEPVRRPPQSLPPGH